MTVEARNRRISTRVRRDKIGSAQRLVDRRFAKRLARARLHSAERAAFMRQSGAIQQTLSRNACTLPKPKRNDDTTPKIAVENFSFIDNPDQTLQSLSDIVHACNRNSVFQIDFNDDVCLDIGPYMVFGLLFNQLPNNRCTGGKMSAQVRKAVDIVGLRKFAGIKLMPYGPAADIWPFQLDTYKSPFRLRHGFEQHESSKEKVTRRFAESVDTWLKQVGFSLNEDGGGWLRTLLGETLDNARHAADDVIDGRWSIAGFMTKRTRQDGSDRFVCHIGIVTVGKTFAQTLQGSDDKAMLDVLRNYATRHTANHRSHDTLMTVSALSDGVSCEGTRQKGTRGGCGMSSLVDMMGKLGGSDRADEQAELVLISGSSCLRLAHPYNVMPIDPDTGGAVQVFNSSQNVELPPDASYVFDLSGTFPGSVISIRFTLDPAHLERRVV